MRINYKIKPLRWYRYKSPSGRLLSHTARGLGIQYRIQRTEKGAPLSLYLDQLGRPPATSSACGTLAELRSMANAHWRKLLAKYLEAEL